MLICLLPFASYACDAAYGDAAGPELPAPPDLDEPLSEESIVIINSCLSKEAEDVLMEAIKDDLPGKEKAFFILGRQFKEAGKIEQAEGYLIKAVETYPVLKDYALKLLTDIHLDSGRYEEAVQAARQITNPLLLKYAGQSEIKALSALKREDQVVEALSRYIERFPKDWDRKYSLALLMKQRGSADQSVSLFKNIYLNAVPLSQDALRELKLLKADLFSMEELLKRADSLYDKGNYKRAEATYRKALGRADAAGKEQVVFLIGRSQFMQKQYSEAARTFGLIKTPEAMYWQATSYYRRNDKVGFERTRKEFERMHPDNHHLALLLLMEADEARRDGRYGDAEANYKTALDRSPDNAEEALWGLAWLNYVSGKYKNANDYFSRLSSYTGSKDYYKYLFWGARSLEKAAKECNESAADQQPGSDNGLCDRKGQDFFSGLPSNETYYGYLIKFHSLSNYAPERIELAEPVRPDGDEYERIEALSLICMQDEALSEILDSIKRAQTNKELLYLAHMAVKLKAYKNVIAFAEPNNDRELLPYSYPLGYWDAVRQAAEANNIDAYLVTALIREESRFDPKVRSWAGAIGLMQLMPSTADRLKRDIKVSLKDRSQLQDPQKNVLLGTYYLSQLIDEFKELPLAIAAYNAGEYRLKKWLARSDSSDLSEFVENIPYKETRKYVQRVLKSYWQYRTINGLPVSGEQLLQKQDSLLATESR